MCIGVGRRVGPGDLGDDVGRGWAGRRCGEFPTNLEHDGREAREVPNESSRGVPNEQLCLLVELGQVQRGVPNEKFNENFNEEFQTRSSHLVNHLRALDGQRLEPGARHPCRRLSEGGDEGSEANDGREGVEGPGRDEAFGGDEGREEMLLGCLCCTLPCANNCH